LVRWVLIGVAALWPVIAFGGGQGYPLLLTIAGALCLPFAATRLRPRLYMAGVAMLLEFAAASAKWSPYPAQLVEIDFAAHAFAMRFDPLTIALVLFWSAILMSAAGRLAAEEAQQVVRVATWAFFAQLIVVAMLSVFQDQALKLFSFAMPNEDEGVQNITRNGIILALAAPFLIVGFERQLPPARALLVEITVFVVVVAVLAIRGVNAPILSMAVALAAVGVVRLFPRNGFRLIGAGIALVVQTAPLLFGILSANADAATATGSASQRLAIWKRVIEVIHEDPVFGRGLGVLRSIQETVPSGKFADQLLIPNHAHNMALQLWAETGAIGATLFAGAVLLAAFRMPEPRRLGVSGFLAAALAGQFMVMTISFDLWNDWLWACAGMLSALIVAMARTDAAEEITER
jgi:O-antigen ligase